MTSTVRDKVRRSVWQAAVACVVGLGYLAWLVAGPDQGLEMLAHFFLTTFVCGPVALVFGVLALRNCRGVYRERKIVLLWLVPTCLVFLLPLIALLVYFAVSVLASEGILVQ